MTVKQLEKEFLREYMAKFNIVALEMPGVDAKIKVHAFIQGLQSGSFFDSLVMNEPRDFSDLLERITPYIHLEEVQMARREEMDRKEKRNPRRREDENKREEPGEARDMRFRQPTPPSRGRYEN